MFLVFLTSFVQVVLAGLLDALLKGNIVVHCNNNWALVPWFFKDQNFIYPLSIVLISGLAGLWVMKKFRFGWKYFLFLAVWWLGGLESLSYWLWITVLNIGQTMWWLPDASLFWWYPKTAPWLNRLFYLKWLSGRTDVTRHGVLLGVVIACLLNLFFAARKPPKKLAFSKKEVYY